MQKHLYIFLLLIVNVAVCQSQETQRPSPLALATIRHNDTYIKITYSQPRKRGREIFGKLVPFGQVWRTGANEATEITVTKDIFINNTLLRAGTYSLFTIPQKDKWTIIINRDLGLWGSYNYNPLMDVMRFDIEAKPAEKTYESFTIELKQRNDLADLLLLWDNIKISTPIKFIH
jgi:hypothetical protein